MTLIHMAGRAFCLFYTIRTQQLFVVSRVGLTQGRSLPDAREMWVEQEGINMKDMGPRLARE